MAQYLLSLYQPVGPAPAPEVLGPIMADLAALNREMRAAGVWLFAAGLHPTDTATVVRQQGTEVLITDGPFAEAKEHLGGFTVIDAEDLDAALVWAGKLARATTLPIEVRPIQH
ncbi:YciI family protein [Arthrobacter sp. AL08]|uniref:YciI family protein n=1 Tax=Micrococcaceae TaxID=1268 RepID=UPI00249A86E0|nr:MULTISPECIES: YciI family protein [Micrococcaceae]MDI3240104.1 YciI family protein [Arthrobacter sp. AL05]MDI3276114.1 YciI family protein [Arthrobacter sp. AL08]MDJ0353880.1 YciI family protein [Pseudarthrobacter sp. PH31-O2]